MQILHSQIITVTQGKFTHMTHMIVFVNSIHCIHLCILYNLNITIMFVLLAYYVCEMRL